MFFFLLLEITVEYLTKEKNPPKYGKYVPNRFTI